MARGVGEKTMLDVLLPSAHTFIFSAIENKTTAEICCDINAAADKGLESTRDLIATKGRAAASVLLGTWMQALSAKAC